MKKAILSTLSVVLLSQPAECGGYIVPITDKLKEQLKETDFFNESREDERIFGSATHVWPVYKDLRKYLVDVADTCQENRQLPLAEIFPAEISVPLYQTTFHLPQEYSPLSFAELQGRFGTTPPPQDDEEKFGARQLLASASNDLGEADLDVQIPDTPDEPAGRAVEDSIPDSYYIGEAHPKCAPAPTNQLLTSGDWAHAIATALSTRNCLARSGEPFDVAAKSLTACCPSSVCTSQCGGNKSARQCAALPAAAEFAASSKLYAQSCPATSLTSAASCNELKRCPLSCAPDAAEGARVRTLRDQREIKAEIQAKGAVVATVRVDFSFLGFRGQGVYKFRAGDLPFPELGYLSVAVVGWGRDKLAGEFWLVQPAFGSVYSAMPQGKQHLFRVPHLAISSVIAIAAGTHGGVHPARPVPEIRQPQRRECGDKLGGYGYCTASCASASVPLKNRAGCAAREVCCLKASSVPQTQCSSDFNGARCSPIAECGEGRKIPGLCPGKDSEVTCCVKIPNPATA